MNKVILATTVAAAMGIASTASALFDNNSTNTTNNVDVDVTVVDIDASNSGIIMNGPTGADSADVLVLNDQINTGDMAATTLADDIADGTWSDVTASAGDDASITVSATAVGNSLSVNVGSHADLMSADGTDVTVVTMQDNVGSHTAMTTVDELGDNGDVLASAGDDASITVSAAAIGNNASVTVGGLDL